MTSKYNLELELLSASDKIENKLMIIYWFDKFIKIASEKDKEINDSLKKLFIKTIKIANESNYDVVDVKRFIQIYSEILFDEGIYKPGTINSYQLNNAIKSAKNLDVDGKIIPSLEKNNNISMQNKIDIMEFINTYLEHAVQLLQVFYESDSAKLLLNEIMKIINSYICSIQDDINIAIFKEEINAKIKQYLLAKLHNSELFENYKLCVEVIDHLANYNYYSELIIMLSFINELTYKNQKYLIEDLSNILAISQKKSCMLVLKFIYDSLKNIRKETKNSRKLDKKINN